MTAPGYTLFDTPIGRCGIAWTAAGVAGVQLPEAHEALTDARIRERCAEATAGAPPPHETRRGAPQSAASWTSDFMMTSGVGGLAGLAPQAEGATGPSQVDATQLLRCRFDTSSRRRSSSGVREDIPSAEILSSTASTRS